MLVMAFRLTGLPFGDILERHRIVATGTRANLAIKQIDVWKTGPFYLR